MKPSDAEAALQDVEVVPLLQMALTEAKRVLEKCLEADIPALLSGDPGCTKGCVPRAILLARQEDAPRIGKLLREEWTELALREGTIEHANLQPIPAEDPDGEPPCPACGCKDPLVDGACPECGLTLA